MRAAIYSMRVTMKTLRARCLRLRQASTPAGYLFSLMLVSKASGDSPGGESQLELLLLSLPGTDDDAVTIALYWALKNAAECSLAFFLSSSRLAALDAWSPAVAAAARIRCSLSRDGLLTARAAATDGKEDRLWARVDMRAAEGAVRRTDPVLGALVTGAAGCGVMDCWDADTGPGWGRTGGQQVQNPGKPVIMHTGRKPNGTKNELFFGFHPCC